MTKSKSYFIEILNNGFVIKDGNSKIAIETGKTVEDFLIKEFKNIISSINKAGVSNMVVNISSDENVPQVLSR